MSAYGIMGQPISKTALLQGLNKLHCWLDFSNIAMQVHKINNSLQKWPTVSQRVSIYY